MTFQWETAFIDISYNIKSQSRNTAFAAPTLLFHKTYQTSATLLFNASLTDKSRQQAGKNGMFLHWKTCGENAKNWIQKRRTVINLSPLLFCGAVLVLQNLYPNINQLSNRSRNYSFQLFPRRTSFENQDVLCNTFLQVRSPLQFYTLAIFLSNKIVNFRKNADCSSAST